MEEHRHAGALLWAVSSNTEALTSLEVGHRGLTTLLERVVNTDKSG